MSAARKDENEMQHLAQRLRLDPAVNIPCNNKIKRWAAQNAYTLLFLSTLFMISEIVNIAVIFFRT